MLNHKINIVNSFISKYEVLLHVIILIICGIPVWGNAYFLTLDGPCHLYNSKIILDYVQGRNTDFYNEFYLTNFKIYPNWFSHASLTFLLSFLSPVFAEKILISIYIILFLLFSRMLIKEINKESVFISYLFFPLLFHFTFQMGFFNYCFSLVFCFAYIVFHIHCEKRLHSGLFMFLSILFSILLFFTHPIGYLLAIVTVGLYILFRKEKELLQFKEKINKLVFYFILLLPSLLLLLYFFSERTEYPAQPNNTSTHDLTNMLFSFKAIATWNNIDITFGKLYIIFAILLLLLCFYFRLKEGKLKRYDFLLIIALSLYMFYFVQPSTIAGAGLVRERIMILPVFFTILWLSICTYPKIIKLVCTFVFFFGSVIFLILKYEPVSKASDAIEEYMELAEYVSPYSVVLPLDFCHNGVDENGKLIADKVWVFTHALDYMGTEKPLIMLDNYEANTGYFPLIWVWEKNPFPWLSKDAGIEGQPPAINLGRYYEKSGKLINYIILYNYRITDLDNAITQNTFEQINKYYTLVKKSSGERAFLYKLKEE